MIAKRHLFTVASLAIVLLSVGCDSPKKSVLELGQDIAAYTKQPSPEIAARIDGGFARLDSQIEKLRSSGQGTEADMWQRERDALQMRYAAATFTGNLQNVKKAAENISEAFRQAGQAIGEAFQSKPEDK